MAEKRGRGQPSKLTPETLKRLLDTLSRGNTYKLACQLAGIDYSTFARWMQKGEAQTKGEYRDFSDAVKAQESRLVDDALTVIAAAALGDEKKPGDWRAMSWLLERRHKEDFGAQRLEVTGKDGAPIVTQFVAVVPPVLDAAEWAKQYSQQPKIEDAKDGE